VSMMFGLAMSLVMCGPPDFQFRTMM